MWFLAQCNRPSPAGSTESVAHPYNNRTKYYAVLSVGRQTFASKRVRRAGQRPSSLELLSSGSGQVALSGGSTAAAGVARSSGSGVAAVAGSGGSGTAGVARSSGSGAAAVALSGGSTGRRLQEDGVAVFRWEEGTDVVLQRSGATLAQIAVYAAGRIDGALGDKLQVGRGKGWRWMLGGNGAERAADCLQQGAPCRRGCNPCLASVCKPSNLLHAWPLLCAAVLVHAGPGSLLHRGLASGSNSRSS